MQDFREFDTDKNDALSGDELKAVLSKQARDAATEPAEPACWQLKRTASDQEVEAFMKQIDLDDNGKVTLEEYIRWVHGDDWNVDGVPVRSLIQPSLVVNILGCQGFLMPHYQHYQDALIKSIYKCLTRSSIIMDPEAQEPLGLQLWNL